jgi:hypothetical protein
VALREAVEIYGRKEATVKAAKTREWLEALALRL